jgi:hypothetical protein|tara:strand:+ start:262 stop:633 length:372 start_codon:yes stop_codon:yes gene_type:complete
VIERRNQTKYSPCIDQTEEEIAAYYRTAKEKDKAIVRQTQGHMLIYKVAEIEGINPSRGRVYVRQFGAFYSKHGKNCFHPKGQTSLVVPTAEVLSWAEQHPRGEFGYSCHRFEGYRSLFKGKP